MAANLHTPWAVQQGIPYIICGKQGPSFGPVTFSAFASEADITAIARLMAAAPKMLEALAAAEVAELHRESRKGFAVWEKLEHKADRLRREALALVKGAA